MKAKYTLIDFNREFPDDDTCLEWLKDFLYPNGIECPICDRITKHHRVKSRKSYSCDECGHHVHPTAGTIYHKSSTSLRLWFYAVYLMSSTRCGISAKQLERELGVTYKTAWRMFKQIRSMLGHDGRQLGGKGGPTVEVDETLVYGKPRRIKGGRTIERPKHTVIGAVERGGRVVPLVFGNPGDPIRTEHMLAFVRANVAPGSTVYSDEHAGYRALPSHGFKHRRVRHWDYEYVRGEVHTNTIEGFWGTFKGGLRGVYSHCGAKYLQSYVNEYAFRYNHRKLGVPMFQCFLAQIQQQDWWIPYADRR